MLKDKLSWLVHLHSSVIEQKLSLSVSKLVEPVNLVKDVAHRLEIWDLASA